MKEHNRMAEEKKTSTAPYLPFLTFLGTLDQLASHGMPNKIDRSVFPSQSGVMQGQIITTLKFFNLIDEHGTPSKTLEALALNADSRKANLKPLITSHYADLVKLDLTKVSPSQLDQKFDEYGVGGDTKKKAKTFFIKAAQFVGLPLSPLLTRKTRSSGPRRRRAGGIRATAQQENQNDFHEPPPASGMSKTLTLKSGGELTLSLSVNLFELIGGEREFVFGLIDKIQEYEGTEK
ncbi:MAG TPA: DUF5343 domain-containing protein [Pyrinomonadaceae bacterium]|jgi:hypothetical protein|nr:DUF5343 domain-containing protein [Pyrinomonadaceae bacterium]